MATLSCRKIAGDTTNAFAFAAPTMQRTKGSLTLGSARTHMTKHDPLTRGCTLLHPMEFLRVVFRFEVTCRIRLRCGVPSLISGLARLYVVLSRLYVSYLPDAFQLRLSQRCRVVPSRTAHRFAPDPFASGWYIAVAGSHRHSSLSAWRSQSAARASHRRCLRGSATPRQKKNITPPTRRRSIAESPPRRA